MYGSVHFSSRCCLWIFFFFNKPIIYIEEKLEFAVSYPHHQESLGTWFDEWTYPTGIWYDIFWLTVRLCYHKFKTVFFFLNAVLFLKMRTHMFVSVRWNGFDNLWQLPYHGRVGLWLHRSANCYWSKLFGGKYSDDIVVFNKVIQKSWISLIYLFSSSAANACNFSRQWCTEEKILGKIGWGASHVCK